MLRESSFEAAKSLLCDMQLMQDPSADVQHAKSYGVPVGRMQRKMFTDVIIADVGRFFNSLGIHVQGIPNVFMAIKLLAIQDIVGDILKISRGTICKVGSADEDWIVEVSDIFQAGPVNEKYYIFINGTYYIPTLNNGNIIYHAWAKTAQLIPRIYVRDSI